VFVCFRATNNVKGEYLIQLFLRGTSFSLMLYAAGRYWALLGIILGKLNRFTDGAISATAIIPTTISNETQSGRALCYQPPNLPLVPAPYFKMGGPPSPSFWLPFTVTFRFACGGDFARNQQAELVRSSLFIFSRISDAVAQVINLSRILFGLWFPVWQLRENIERCERLDVRFRDVEMDKKNGFLLCTSV